ncbi:MAG: hypothetical protein EA343_15085 [Nodularia sp. (in: Bacteria)]|nr:MAG: hypothetical protein EA343_15085 [Nodularia sp. (in: cyanobacteria)]
MTICHPWTQVRTVQMSCYLSGIFSISLIKVANRGLAFVYQWAKNLGVLDANTNGHHLATTVF